MRMNKRTNEWMNVCMKEWMNGWMNVWMNEWMNEWMDAWMNGWMDAWMNGWMDEWMDGWMDGWKNDKKKIKKMDRWTGEWMDKCIGEWMNGWMDEWKIELLDIYDSAFPMVRSLIAPCFFPRRLPLPHPSCQWIRLPFSHSDHCQLILSKNCFITPLHQLNSSIRGSNNCQFAAKL